MVKTVNAIFDGEVLRTEEPINLEPNTRVKLTITTEEKKVSLENSFLLTARSLQLDGPSDWSMHFDDYLYGMNEVSDK